MAGTRDPLNAFLDVPQVPVFSTPTGLVAGLRLGVKDIFDVAGYRTGCGNPEKHAEAKPAERTAPAIDKLVRVSKDRLAPSGPNRIAAQSRTATSKSVW